MQRRARERGQVGDLVFLDAASLAEALAVLAKAVLVRPGLLAIVLVLALFPRGGLTRALTYWLASVRRSKMDPPCEARFDLRADDDDIVLCGVCCGRKGKRGA